MLCNVNRCLFPFSVQNKAFASRALSAYTTSAPASQGGAAGDAAGGVLEEKGGCRCSLTRLEASGVGSMTAELGPVQRARCRRLDHGKHVLCCGEWTRAAGRWLPCWEAASSAVLLGLEKAAASSCPSGDGPLCYLYSRRFPTPKPGVLNFSRPHMPRFLLFLIQLMLQCRHLLPKPPMYIIQYL